MNCSECQDLISDFIDGDLEEPQRAIVGMHIESCRECYSVHQDLEQIVQVSRDLPLLVPQNTLWQQIEQEIQELTDPSYRRPSRWQRFWGYQLTISMPQLTSAVVGLTALFFLANSFAYLPQRALSLSNPGQTTVVAQPVNHDMNLTEAELAGAIDRLGHTVNQRRSSWDPELQQLFDRNVAIVDRSLNDCRQLVQRNPKDQVAHEMLIIAYQEKLRLFEQFASL
jgi:hypothetical protein